MKSAKHGSLPAGERGLKFYRLEHIDKNLAVAPRRGAWIEINDMVDAFTTALCRSPQGSVD